MYKENQEGPAFPILPVVSVFAVLTSRTHGVNLEAHTL